MLPCLHGHSSHDGQTVSRDTDAGGLSADVYWDLQAAVRGRGFQKGSIETRWCLGGVVQTNLVGNCSGLLKKDEQRASRDGG